MKLFLHNLLVISFMFSFWVLLFIVGKWVGSLFTNEEVLQVYTGSAGVILFVLTLGMTLEEDF